MAGTKKKNKNQKSLIAENRFEKPAIKSSRKKILKKKKKLLSRLKSRFFNPDAPENQLLFFKGNLEIFLAY